MILLEEIKVHANKNMISTFQDSIILNIFESIFFLVSNPLTSTLNDPRKLRRNPQCETVSEQTNLAGLWLTALSTVY